MFIFVGESAGGNLAAAVSLKFRNEERRRRFALHIPIVPCLQVGRKGSTL